MGGLGVWANRLIRRGGNPAIISPAPLMEAGENVAVIAPAVVAGVTGDGELVRGYNAPAAEAKECWDLPRVGPDQLGGGKKLSRVREPLQPSEELLTEEDREKAFEGFGQHG